MQSIPYGMFYEIVSSIAKVCKYHNDYANAEMPRQVIFQLRISNFSNFPSPTL